MVARRKEDSLRFARLRSMGGIRSRCFRARSAKVGHKHFERVPTGLVSRWPLDLL
jgi:hypothetical protein